MSYHEARIFQCQLMTGSQINQQANWFIPIYRVELTKVMTVF